MAQIVLDDVWKVYADGTEAVRALDLHIEDGEFMVLVGPSGCGKTTALRMLAGLEEITEGEIRIADRVVNDPSRHAASSPRVHVPVASGQNASSHTTASSWSAASTR